VPEMNETIAFGPKGNVLMVNTGEAGLQSAEDGEEAEAYCIGTSLFTVNLKKPGPLQQLHFRKALHDLINRLRMVDELGEPRLYPASGFQWDGFRPTLFDKDHLEEEALHLLRQSGYNGEPIQLYTYPRHAPDARWLKDEYGKYGIKMEINIVSWKEMLNEANMEKADLILFEAVVSEGAIKLLEYYQCKTSFIRQHLPKDLTSQVDGWIDNLLAEPEETVRRHKLNIIEQTLREEYAFIVLVHKNVSAFSHPSLQGVKVNPRGWVEFKDLWFQDPSAFI
jgi:SgrR family transcriptional regulator